MDVLQEKLKPYTKVPNPNDPLELPNAIGHWIRRHPTGEGQDEMLTVNRDESGELFWYFNGRPVMDFDKGEYYGPLKLVPVE